MDLKSKIIDEEFSDEMIKKLCPHEIEFIKHAMDRFVRELIPTKKEISEIRDTYAYSNLSPLFKDGFRFGAKEVIRIIENGLGKD